MRSISSSMSRTDSATSASPSSSACTAVRIITPAKSPMPAMSTGKFRRILLQQIQRPDGNAHRHVADPLQIAVDLDHRQDEPQIDRHRLLPRQQLVGHLIHFALRRV